MPLNTDPNSMSLADAMSCLAVPAASGSATPKQKAEHAVTVEKLLQGIADALGVGLEDPLLPNLWRQIAERRAFVNDELKLVDFLHKHFPAEEGREGSSVDAAIRVMSGMARASGDPAPTPSASSPLPWRYSPRDNPMQGRVVDARGGSVAASVLPENGEFIVAQCNGRDEAQLALREISELVGEGGDNTPFWRVEEMLSKLTCERDDARQRVEEMTARELAAHAHADRGGARPGGTLVRRVEEMADRIIRAEHVIVRCHAADLLSEGQAAKAIGADRIALRDMVLAHEEVLREEGRREAEKLTAVPVLAPDYDHGVAINAAASLGSAAVIAAEQADRANGEARIGAREAAGVAKAKADAAWERVREHEGRGEQKADDDHELVPCGCHRCCDDRGEHPMHRLMVLCPKCGNKRCPRASDHRLECTNSNEPGQKGSVYGEAAMPANEVLS